MYTSWRLFWKPFPFIGFSFFLLLSVAITHAIKSTWFLGLEFSPLHASKIKYRTAASLVGPSELNASLKPEPNRDQPLQPKFERQLYVVLSEGVWFLVPTGRSRSDLRSLCREIRQVVYTHGLVWLGWRRVWTKSDVLGKPRDAAKLIDQPPRPMSPPPRDLGPPPRRRRAIPKSLTRSEAQSRRHQASIEAVDVIRGVIASRRRPHATDTFFSAAVAAAAAISRRHRFPPEPASDDVLDCRRHVTGVPRAAGLRANFDVHHLRPSATTLKLGQRWRSYGDNKRARPADRSWSRFILSYGKLWWFFAELISANGLFLRHA